MKEGKKRRKNDGEKVGGGRRKEDIQEKGEKIHRYEGRKEGRKKGGERGKREEQ